MKMDPVLFWFYLPGQVGDVILRLGFAFGVTLYVEEFFMLFMHIGNLS